jgi:tetrahydromethanopterin S-methyltransferase subunit B
MTPIEHSNDITQRFINQRKEEIQTINNLREAIYQLEAIVEDRERSLDNVCNAVLFWARIMEETILIFINSFRKLKKKKRTQ